MTSELLVKAARTGRDIVKVTPQSARWTYVGFEALRLQAGEEHRLETGDRELCLVLLSGYADVQVGATHYARLGNRASVFDDKAPGAIYIPPGQSVQLRACEACEVALCSAPGDDQSRPVRVIDPASMRRSVRGHLRHPATRRSGRGAFAGGGSAYPTGPFVQLSTTQTRP